MEKKHATIYRSWYFAIYVSNPSFVSLNDLNIRLSPIYDTLVDWAFCRIRSVYFCVATAFILQLSNLYFRKYVTINQSIHMILITCKSLDFNKVRLLAVSETAYLC